MSNRIPILILILSALRSHAAVDESKLPPSTTTPVDYTRDIKPIFEASCFRCHGPEKPKSKFRLDNQAAALKGGENGVDILPGQSAKSPLIHYVSRLDPDMEMPPKGKGDALTPAQVTLLRGWIDQGANWGKEETAPQLAFSITPAVRWITVSGDEGKFREQTWMQEGWSGGLQNFNLQERLTNGVKVNVDGRVFQNQRDYQIRIAVDKEDLGFARMGFEQYRKYFDDTGGYDPAISPKPLSLDRELGMDIGKAWFDVGLTLPNWPRIVAGYEYQYRDGTEASLEWGHYSRSPSDPFGKAIAPSAREVDEKVHILKLDVTDEIKGVLIEDNFKGEFYKLDTEQSYNGWFSSRLGEHQKEKTDYFQGANALRLEKQLRDWLFVSGGYLFSRYDGSAGFSQDFFTPAAPAAPGFLGDVSNQIILNQWSHVFNANAQLGPWNGLTFAAGLQNDWTRQEGIASALTIGAIPVAMNANLDREALNETLGLRYTAIPWTVVFADVQFQQEKYDHYESNLSSDGSGGDHDFIRDTDAATNLKEYRTGFTVSPWQRVSFSSSLKHSEKKNDYNHLTDIDLSATPGNGYPAFIRSRNLNENALEAKLVLRLAAWCKTTLKYQLDSIDYYTVTGGVDDGTGSGNYTAGGGILAGNYDAHIWSVNSTITPWKRLYLSSTFSYSKSRIISGVNNDASVVPYQGDTYSVLSSANFVLNNKTDLHASYSFSKSDYGQNNFGVGLPLGIVYERHGALAGITRRFKKFMTGTLQYGYFYYNEPSSAGVNNYTAHSIFGSMNFVIR